MNTIATSVRPVSLSASGALWLAFTAVIAVAFLLLIGVEQGAVSVFGSTSQVHEFVHDARHLLGFPCH